VKIFGRPHADRSITFRQEFPSAETKHRRKRTLSGVAYHAGKQAGASITLNHALA